MTAWTAVLLCDGEPVCGPVPCDDYDAASIIAPVVVGWLGGPVSIVRAVAATRPVIPQGSLFDAEPMTDEEWHDYAMAAGFEP